MNDLITRLNSVQGSYFEFVDTVVSYVKKKDSRLENINNYLDKNPLANSADILEFVIHQPDYMENVVSN